MHSLCDFGASISIAKAHHWSGQGRSVKLADEPNQKIIEKRPSLIGDSELKLPGIDFFLF